MVATMTFIPRHGTRLRRGDARAWEQRPSVAKVIVNGLGGFPTTDDNSRSVSAAEERRHR
jgi:hypothetical protein